MIFKANKAKFLLILEKFVFKNKKFAIKDIDIEFTRIINLYNNISLLKLFNIFGNKLTFGNGVIPLFICSEKLTIAQNIAK